MKLPLLHTAAYKTDKSHESLDFIYIGSSTVVAANEYAGVFIPRREALRAIDKKMPKEALIHRKHWKELTKEFNHIEVDRVRNVITIHRARKMYDTIPYIPSVGIYPDLDSTLKRIERLKKEQIKGDRTNAFAVVYLRHLEPAMNSIAADWTFKAQGHIFELSPRAEDSRAKVFIIGEQ